MQQLSLFSFADESLPALCAGANPVARAAEGFVSDKALKDNHATAKLMDSAAYLGNLVQAAKRVISNKGSAGVDGATVDTLRAWKLTDYEELSRKLKSGLYEPQMVKGKKIAKQSGGQRQLGIPTIVDRLVQQALLQVMEPILDPTFSPSSYGFRPKRSAHMAIKSGSAYVKAGYYVVVDLDLEKFFDKVNHDILMGFVAQRISDKRVLKLIRKFLQAGMMSDGVCIERKMGTPQGGPLSPLLANLMLDKLDKELEKRNHRFCRYADDCNIYVCSRTAGERVLKSVSRFIESKLKLIVNKTKSAVDLVSKRKFLGLRLLEDGRISIAPKSLEKLKGKLKRMTRRNRGKAFEDIVSRLNPVIRGWVNYMKVACARSHMKELDSWLRRRLRCYKLHQCKRAIGIARFLMSLRVNKGEAFKLGGSSKGWWRKSKSPQGHFAMNNAWFKEQGLLSFETVFTG